MERLEIQLRELKFAGAEMTFSGYGAAFGNVDSYGDVIQKGAFANTIATAKASGVWPKMLSQHGAMGLTAQDLTPIGVWTSLSEDDNGLVVEGKLAPTPRGQEMHALMKMEPRPAIDGLSIGYSVVRAKNRANASEPRRTLEEIRLYEISPVTFPANAKALIGSVKSIEDILTLADAEQLLREAGFSKAEALAFVSQVKNIGRSDSARGDRSDSVSTDLIAALNAREIHLPQ
jgi:HK97 family phage prohead protease